MRVPGTANRKLEPVPVAIAEHDWTARYTPADLDALIPAAPARATTRAGRSPTGDLGDRPGDRYNATHTCDDVLLEHGFVFHSASRCTNGEPARHYTRHGEDPHDGSSATVYDDTGNCTIFTSSVPGLERNATYEMWGLHVRLAFGRDFTPAASA